MAVFRKKVFNIINKMLSSNKNSIWRFTHFYLLCCTSRSFYNKDKISGYAVCSHDQLEPANSALSKYMINSAEDDASKSIHTVSSICNVALFGSSPVLEEFSTKESQKSADIKETEEHATSTKLTANTEEFSKPELLNSLSMEDTYPESNILLVCDIPKNPNATYIQNTEALTKVVEWINLQENVNAVKVHALDWVANWIDSHIKWPKQYKFSKPDTYILACFPIKSGYFISGSITKKFTGFKKLPNMEIKCSVSGKAKREFIILGNIVYKLNVQVLYNNNGAGLSKCLE
ncbi:hypothetical protein NEPAR04_1243 [Nematocida parisii]|nr:hypothetical protein NEPAR08_1311 [Nematocida parisii]KAI5128562.1 hypothetical protein NEPAR03_1369 [Nematocida parisii]KAI5141860.1 hypothetical protein NEPAR04_1243 [Nematocida parisii]